MVACKQTCTPAIQLNSSFRSNKSDCYLKYLPKRPVLKTDIQSYMHAIWQNTTATGSGLSIASYRLSKPSLVVKAEAIKVSKQEGKIF